MKPAGGKARVVIYRPPPHTAVDDDLVKSGLKDRKPNTDGKRDGVDADDGSQEEEMVVVPFDLASSSTRYPETRMMMAEVVFTFIAFFHHSFSTFPLP
jgi:hypothetical protein